MILWILNKKNIKNKFFSYITTCILTSAILILIFAWWSYKSDKILLNHYGYNFNGMNETEYYEHVSAENLVRVKNLEYSIKGIGWPLKAIMTFVFYFPYLLIAYFGNNLISHFRKSN